jgi:hypothetical protein
MDRGLMKIYDPKFQVLNILSFYPTSSPISITIGIEIECEFRDITVKELFVQDFYSKMELRWLLKRDLSLINGIELVSCPMTIEYFSNEIAKIIEIANKYNLSTSERTGIHVHIRKTANDLSIFRFINNVAFREEIVSFAGRLSDYARYTTKLHPNLQQRGYSVNLKPPTTIEFRLFQSKLDYEWIMGCIYFCEIIVNNIQSLSNYNDIITHAKHHHYPPFFIYRLENVNITPPNKTYSVIDPMSNPEFW